MLEQFGIQYGINGCCLRAPWIMEKDDFKLHAVLRRRCVRRAGLEDARARGATRSAMPRTARCRCCATPTAARSSAISSMSTISSRRSWRRSTIRAPKRQLFNICMDRPVDYGEVAAYLARTRGLDSVDIPSQFHSNWMDNSKAKYLLGLAARIRSGNAYRLGLGPTSVRQRILASSGIRVDVMWRAHGVRHVSMGGSNEESTVLLAAAVLALTAGPGAGGQEAAGHRREGPRQPVLRGDQPRVARSGTRRTPSSEYECFYTGPASTSDEAGEAQIVQDMLGKADTAAIAISPSNAKLIAQTHQDRQARRSRS